MKKTLLILFAIFFFATLQSQTQKAVADTKYEKFAYVDAIKIYEKLAKKGYKSSDLYQKLANSYYFNAELEKANSWYAKLFSLDKILEPEYYYRYSQTLKATGNYAKANEMLAIFNQKKANDSRGKLYSNQQNYLDIIKENSGRFSIENLKINSEYSDYGTAVLNSKLIFASARDTSGIINRKHEWTDQSFTQLYEAEIMPDGSLGKPEKFSRSINSKFNESTPIFTKDGKTVYFTRNNYIKGKKGKSSKRITLLKIYKAEFIADKWTNIVALPFTSDNYSTAHPALSFDEKTLYFASDMPGTLGQSDLFMVAINADGSFGNPINLGNKINTEGRETFPFVSEKEFYFASEGHLGLGGLDIFVSKIHEDGSFGIVKNIGSPVNGPKDDFAFFINDSTRSGYFSSNRAGGKGNDDIYKFQETKKLDCEQLLTGTVTDLNTKLPIAGAKVTLANASFEVIKIIYADANAKFNFDAECGFEYYVKAESTGYNTIEKQIKIPDFSGETDLPIDLEKSLQKITVGSDLAKIFDIQNIYFDLDKWDIRQDAANDLAKIIETMQEYPKMKVDVRSHTDSRQTREYNDRLSNQRVKSTIAWLIENGIAKERLSGKGYGETQLLNNCADGINCTEAQHQMNRRSEFIIVEM
ncbi:OmpA family protein [uncultured Flavobacterium sp.]|uniref:OmpA family protein n=1 Tax=uncultured Flavobacterium sp. TaxID=165435 RepID=UPI0025D36596|nr:OmpA family protein [uncultured Flavobacterium sp.]